MTRREPGKHGLFEFVIVLIVIALLGAALMRYLAQITDAAWAVSLETQAQAFAKTVGLLHWSWAQRGVNYRAPEGNKPSGVALDGEVIFVNRYGWPTHLDPADSRKPLQARGCLAVWNAVMQKPGPALVVTGAWQDTRALQVKVVGESRCRFAMHAKGFGLHYFDYDVKTGEVTTHATR
ncbi:hypothetical protein L1F30_10430 [Simiduia sp. 21SJ11W-1]|uniref:hypothetical protein n=1 Tax=Simiduia sp. 21SJ11W-1 TaxID=2909669 RepID=UPI00209DB176|nr:hypothetical protein [Simiduia sp. 21SJ11W-1]UTA46581.1 hypothetical protein L1F30_10430 [Simiduia sp. 21SJ11W-1]